jgi:hypothetical protein
MNPLVEPERVRDFFSPTKKPDVKFNKLEKQTNIVKRSIKWPRLTLLIAFVILAFAPACWWQHDL